MTRRFKAVYQRGVFVPRTPCTLPEDSEVELTIEDPYLLPAEERDPKKRAQILDGLVERMLRNPFPSDAPRFTRDELHERR